eukprot:1141820-Pelagomonas_calceolata.AAC.3
MARSPTVQAGTAKPDPPHSFAAQAPKDKESRDELLALTLSRHEMKAAIISYPSKAVEVSCDDSSESLCGEPLNLYLCHPATRASASSRRNLQPDADLLSYVACTPMKGFGGSARFSRGPRDARKSLCVGRDKVLLD